MDHAPRRIADYLRSTADLTDFFRACGETGDLDVVESAFCDVPEWATFHEVRSALGAAGLHLCVRGRGGASSNSGHAAGGDRRRAPRGRSH